MGIFNKKKKELSSRDILIKEVYDELSNNTYRCLIKILDSNNKQVFCIQTQPSIDRVEGRIYIDRGEVLVDYNLNDDDKYTIYLNHLNITELCKITPYSHSSDLSGILESEYHLDIYFGIIIIKYNSEKYIKEQKEYRLQSLFKGLDKEDIKKYLGI